MSALYNPFDEFESLIYVPPTKIIKCDMATSPMSRPATPPPADDCPICYEPFNTKVTAICGHSLCLPCYIKVIAPHGINILVKALCPMCRGSILPPAPPPALPAPAAHPNPDPQGIPQMCACCRTLQPTTTYRTAYFPLVTNRNICTSVMRVRETCWDCFDVFRHHRMRAAANPDPSRYR